MRSEVKMFEDLFNEIFSDKIVLHDITDKVIKPTYNDVYGLQTKCEDCTSFEPINVIFNAPATVVFWCDGTKTVVKCHEDDVYDKEKGLAMAYMKKLYGNNGSFNEVLKRWCPYEY